MRYLNRKEQVAYIRERGLKISQNQIAKLAHTGGGPRYAIWGNQAVSTPEWLDEWIEQKLTAPRFTTSERASDEEAA